MKKLYKYIFIFLLLIHLYFLHVYGIATFITSVIFYYCLYWLLKKITTKFFVKDIAKYYIHNLKMILFVLLFFEIFISLSNSKLNDFTEKKYFAFLSKYIKSKQLILFNKIGLTTNKVTSYENGYIPNTKKTHKTSEFSYKVYYNSIGLRGNLPKIIKDTNEYRITIIGDSFVEGYGTTTDSTFPYLLNKKLNINTQNFSVINGGVCGSNPDYEIKLYNKLLKKYNSDLIIIELNNGDLLDYKISKAQGNMPFGEYFFACSKVYRVFYTLINNEINLNKHNKKEIAGLVNKISNFNDKLKNNSQTLLILYLPLKNEIFDAKNISIHNEITRKLNENNIAFIDLHTLYRNYFNTQQDSLNLYYWKTDGHHNGKGYNLCAEIVTNEIQKFIKNK